MQKININDFSLLSHFPNIELFYNYNYKKVYSYEYVLAIPKGNKSFVWFTYYNNVPCAILLNISITYADKNNNYCNNYNFINGYILNTIFKNDLMGTIFYGTNLIISNHSYFFIEDLFNYDNNHLNIISNKNAFIEKFNSINNILKNKIYFSTDKNSIIFGVPLIHNNYSKLLNLIKNVPYEIKEITYILNNSTTHSFYKYKNFTENNVFKVCKTEQTDIYKLYTLNKNDNCNNNCDNNKHVDHNYIFHSIAYIPNYKISTMMNKIFYNLKDHNNLDYLEDSDEEEDKDAHEEQCKNVLMICEFNYKFEKWVPLRLIS